MNYNDDNEYQRWLNAVNRLWVFGWRCRSGWVFVAPGGTQHDLSAADISSREVLERIEREGLFLVESEKEFVRELEEMERELKSPGTCRECREKGWVE